MIKPSPRPEAQRNAAELGMAHGMLSVAMPSARAMAFYQPSKPMPLPPASGRAAGLRWRTGNRLGLRQCGCHEIGGNGAGTPARRLWPQPARFGSASAPLRRSLRAEAASICCAGEPAAEVDAAGRAQAFLRRGTGPGRARLHRTWRLVTASACGASRSSAKARGDSQRGRWTGG